MDKIVEQPEPKSIDISRGPTISVCANAHTSECVDIDMIDVLNDIKNGKYAVQIDRIRSATEKKQRQALKKELPGACFSGRFSKRSNQDLIERSGYICADLDDIENPEGWREKFASDPHVAAAFVSPSGNGLKLLVKIDLDRSHEACWADVKAYIYATYELEIDAACKDVSRLCFASHDPDCFIADPSTVEVLRGCEVPQERPERSTKAKGQPDYSEVRDALMSIPPRPEYDQWLKICSAVWSELGESGTALLELWSPGETSGEYEYKYSKRLERIKIETLFHIAREGGWKPDREKGKSESADSPGNLIKLAKKSVGGKSKADDSGLKLNAQPAIYPADSILADWMGFAIRFTEAEDSFILGSIMPICAAILGRRVWIDFGGRKYPNLYAILAAKPGFRKSTSIGLARKLGKSVLNADQFTSGLASEEALFREYSEEDGGTSDKILIVDEGNTILSNWQNQAYGKIVAKRYLNLYDCGDWKQSFQKNMKTGGSVVKYIEETSTSVLIGATLDIASFQGLESADGMKRRFLTYLCKGFARTIYFPQSPHCPEFEDLIEKFRKLTRFAGEFTFDESGKEEWISIQDRNRKNLGEIPDSGYGYDRVRATLLSEEPSHTLKIAMIFVCCRRAAESNPSQGPLTLSGEALMMANLHVADCIRASMDLDSLSSREKLLKDCDRIHDIVLDKSVAKNFTARQEEDGVVAVLASKSNLTRQFCHNPARSGALDTGDLYNRILPELIRQKRCFEIESGGMKKKFCFHNAA